MPVWDFTHIIARSTSSRAALSSQRSLTSRAGPSCVGSPLAIFCIWAMASFDSVTISSSPSCRVIAAPIAINSASFIVGCVPRYNDVLESWQCVPAPVISSILLPSVEPSCEPSKPLQLTNCRPEGFKLPSGYQG
ncbi:hypothetical protein BDZ91DRAFT_730042 [Kalaharituber pfeilii]|nr:hypothetical protein BDZ91DRAFT_730042 [Kalaharituber pfeilii]